MAVCLAQLLADIDRVLDAGRPRVADLLLDAADSCWGADPRLVVRRARAALAQDLPLLARSVLDAALESGMASAELWLWRARAWLASDDPATACVDAMQALRCDPADAQAAGLSAALLMEAQRPGQAACLLDAAIQAGAADPALHVALSVALLCCDEPIAASAALARGLAVFPGNPDLLRLHGQAKLP